MIDKTTAHYLVLKLSLSIAVGTCKTKAGSLIGYVQSSALEIIMWTSLISLMLEAAAAASSFIFSSLCIESRDLLVLFWALLVHPDWLHQHLLKILVLLR